MSSLGANLPVLLLVGVILGGASLVLSLLSRRLRAGAGRDVVRLTSQHQLHVVEIAGRRLVVGTGPDGAPRLVYALDEERARGG